MNKFKPFLIVIIFFYSCQTEKIIDNNTIIQKIDKLNFTKTVFEVSLDHNENIKDTISIEKTKINEKGIVVYKSKEYPNKYNNSKRSDYYRDNEDLFYQEFLFENGKYKSIYETFVDESNIIDRAQMISIEPNVSDTIFMKYNYSYNKDGKKESLIVSSVKDTINAIHFTQYNDYEMAELEYQIIQNDTLDKTQYIYNNGKIIQSIKETMNPIKIDIYNYNSQEKLISNKIFIEQNDDIVQLSESTYKYSKKNELESRKIKDFQNDTIIKYKYITTHNNVYN